MRSFVVKRAQKGAVNIARTLTQGTCLALPRLRRRRASRGLDASHGTRLGVPMHRGIGEDGLRAARQRASASATIPFAGGDLGWAMPESLTFGRVPSVTHPSYTMKSEVNFAPHLTG